MAIFTLLFFILLFKDDHRNDFVADADGWKPTLVEKMYDLPDDL